MGKAPGRALEPIDPAAVRDYTAMTSFNEITPDASVAFKLGLAQRWIAGHLPAAEIEEISAIASGVIGDEQKANQWLSEPNVAMDNRAPIDLIGEKDGYERVKSLLLRIEYGVLA